MLLLRPPSSSALRTYMLINFHTDFRYIYSSLRLQPRVREQDLRVRDRTPNNDSGRRSPEIPGSLESPSPNQLLHDGPSVPS